MKKIFEDQKNKELFKKEIKEIYEEAASEDSDESQDEASKVNVKKDKEEMEDPTLLDVLCCFMRKSEKKEVPQEKDEKALAPQEVFDEELRRNHLG